MWSDNETTQDLLGFEIHAELLKSLITNNELLPITIGLFGDWGGGKTSVMKMVQDLVNPENYEKHSSEYKKFENVVCLYFNGWLFEGYEDAKSALLSSILLELSENKKFGEKVKEKAKILLKSIDWMRLVKFGINEIALPLMMSTAPGVEKFLPILLSSATNFFPSGDSSNNGQSNSDEKLNNTDQLGIRAFRDNFSELLEKTEIESLIILIDDLDRCAPKRIIESLEAIKLFLNVPKTAFIIGADQRIVQYAISSVYDAESIGLQANKSESPTDFVTDYLEKLIQVPYQLPRLSPNEVQTYMSLLFCQRDLNAENLSKVMTAYKKHKSIDRYKIFGYGSINDALDNHISEGLANSLSLCTKIGSLITDGLKGNPRQVKRFMNAFTLRRKLAEIAKIDGIRDEVLVKLMVLEYTHDNQFNDLFEWQSRDNGFPQEIKKIEETIKSKIGIAQKEKVIKEINSSWNDKFLIKWAEMEPFLSDVDLRDYFWIARDKLHTTLSNVAMVSPIIRKTFENLISSNDAVQEAAHLTIQKFEPGDIDILFSLIDENLIRNPEERNFYVPYEILAQWKIPDSCKHFAAILLKLPKEKIPPAIGIALQLLVKQNPADKDDLTKAIKQLGDSQTIIGQAIRTVGAKG